MNNVAIIESACFVFSDSVAIGYYEEEHRKKLENFAQEQVRLTSEAEEYARQAAASAEEAASSAAEAIDQAE